MTPEELKQLGMEASLKILEIEGVYNEHDISKILEPFLLQAAKEAYEDIIKICDESENIKWSFLELGLEIDGLTPKDIAMTIRKRIKELET